MVNLALAMVSKASLQVTVGLEDMLESAPTVVGQTTLLTHVFLNMDFHQAIRVKARIKGLWQVLSQLPLLIMLQNLFPQALLHPILVLLNSSTTEF